MRHSEQLVRVVRFGLLHCLIEAMRVICFVPRKRHVVDDDPLDLDHREFPMVRRVLIMLGMSGQRESPPRIDAAHPADTVVALGLRLPFLHADLAEMVATLLLGVRIAARIFIHFGLRREIALIGHCWNRRRFRIGWRGRILVVECSRRQQDRLQRPRSGPLRQRVHFAMNARAGKFDRCRRKRLERLKTIGNHQRMGFAVLRLFPDAVQALGFEQPVNEIPVGFVLTAVRARRQRLRQFKAIHPACLRMIVEYIGNDRVDAFVLPVTLVAAELQKMQPRRETELVAREATVYAEFSRGMNVAVVRKIGLVGLLDPQRDRLRNQCLELDIVRRRHAVDHEQVISTDTGLPIYPMGIRTLLPSGVSSLRSRSCWASPPVIAPITPCASIAPLSELCCS